MCRELTKFLVFYLFRTDDIVQLHFLKCDCEKKNVATFLLSSIHLSKHSHKKTLPTRRPCLFLHFNSVRNFILLLSFLKKIFVFDWVLVGFFHNAFFRRYGFSHILRRINQNAKALLLFLRNSNTKQFTLIKCIPVPYDVTIWIYLLNTFQHLVHLNEQRKIIRRAAHFFALRNTPK